MSVRPGTEAVLYTRRGCSACDEALAELERICAEFGCPVRIVDVDLADGLPGDYGPLVPVIEVAGEVVSEFGISARAVRARLGTVSV